MPFVLATLGRVKLGQGNGDCLSEVQVLTCGLSHLLICPLSTPKMEYDKGPPSPRPSPPGEGDAFRRPHCLNIGTGLDTNFCWKRFLQQFSVPTFVGRDNWNIFWLRQSSAGKIYKIFGSDNRWKQILEHFWA